MAIVSSHTLNGTDGSHAGGLGVRLINRDSGEILFATTMDAGGRLREQVPNANVDPAACYELVFITAAYWRTENQLDDDQRVIEEIVVRFTMPDPAARYHIPVILSPNSYSVWSSQPEQGA